MTPYKVQRSLKLFIKKKKTVLLKTILLKMYFQKCKSYCDITEQTLKVQNWFEVVAVVFIVYYPEDLHKSK